MAEYLLKPGIECQRTDPVFFHALPDHNAEKTPAFKKPLAHKMLPEHTDEKYCFYTTVKILFPNKIAPEQTSINNQSLSVF